MPPTSPPVKRRPVHPADYPAIRQLAEEIWPEVYASIITPAQIDYMIERMYARETIAREVQQEGIRYEWITLHDEKIGILSYGPVRRGVPCFLHKLYVTPSRHGRGIGSAALRSLLEQLEKAGSSHLDLRVNRKNESAIRCYQRNGFEKVAEDCLEIGDGFVMDDFVMSHPLNGDKLDFSIAQKD